MLDYILARLAEASTWKGIIWFVTAFGVTLDPSQKEAIVSFGLTLVGLINVFVDRGRPHTDEEIIKIVQEEHEKNVEKQITVPKEKKNVKKKPVVSDNFFND